MIEIVSFSYMMNMDIPLENNGFHLIDCRELPDPQGLGYGFSGQEQAIQEYVFQDAEAEKLVSVGYNLILLERYDKNKSIKIAFGCEGGKNRSVSCAEVLSSLLSKEGTEHKLEHLAIPFWKQYEAQRQRDKES